MWPTRKAVRWFWFPGFGWDVWWSPDSTRIATWVEFGTSIAIYNLEGERQALLTVPLLCGGSGDHDPRWSLDGTSIVVPSSCEIPIDGGPTSRDPGYRWVYSPDGTRVAHVTHTGDGETFDSSVVITEASGTVLRSSTRNLLPARRTQTSYGRHRVIASCSVGLPAGRMVTPLMTPPPSFARSTSAVGKSRPLLRSRDSGPSASRPMVIASFSRPGTAHKSERRGTQDSGA